VGLWDDKNDSVQAKENDERREGGALVAVDEWIVTMVIRNEAPFKAGGL
jgi:hypothetical protein